MNLRTWSGTHVPLRMWRQVILGWVRRRLFERYNRVLDSLGLRTPSPDEFDEFDGS